MMQQLKENHAMYNFLKQEIEFVMFTMHFLEKISEPSMKRDVVIVLIFRDDVDGRLNPLHSSLERISSKTALMPFC